MYSTIQYRHGRYKRLHKQIEIIARKHKDWVKIAQSFGALTEAEDIVQEMYIRLDKYLKPDQEVSTSFVWITLRNIYFDFIKHEPKDVELIYDKPDDVSDSFGIFAYENLNESLKSKLNELHWFDKKLFELYVDSGKSMRELSKDTKISLSCIFNTISKVRSYINEELKEDYEDYLNNDYEWLKEKHKD